VRFDLHCHSTCSDGTDAPAALAARAAARGVQVFALTDHDTTEATGLAVEGARSIRATEVSCTEEDRTVHVLMFERPGGNFQVLIDRLAAVRTARVNRMRVMAAKLAQRGIRIDVEPLIAAAAKRSVGRPDLARLMVEAKVVTSVKEAFSRHLYDGGPIDVKAHALPMAEAIRVGTEAGAAMSLAHPHLYGDWAPVLLQRHRAIDAIECCYGSYDQGERRHWLGLADRLKLVATAGSDWHGPEDAGADLGVDLDDARSDALLTWLG